MANSTEKNYDEMILEQYLVPFTLLVVSVLAGLVIQSFIVTVNIIDWMKGRLITGADKILTSIGISRIFFHVAFLLFLSDYFSEITIYSIFLSCALESLNLSNIWFSALLSIFFYFKISTSHNVFILRLKVIMSKRVTYLIFASFILSLGYTSMNGLFSVVFFSNSTQAYTSDITQLVMMLDYFIVLWNVVPLLMSFITSILLIILLGLHTSNLKNHGHADTYRRTITFTVLSFLVCSFYIILNVLHMCIPSILEVLWWCFIINDFPALHSILLIYVATKLRNQFFRIVHCGTDCLFNRNAPGPHSRGPKEETPL